MDIKNIDHIVLSVADVDASVKFYEEVLGMQAFCFTGADGQERKAVKFGATKINFHDLRAPVKPNAKNMTAGSADICLICAQPLEEILEELKAKGVAPIDGIVARSGTNGKIRSLYLRDPDGNLLKLSNYV
ncbi:VOC family protein [Campylobacter curvus]|uniref:VOC family protein n=1 Tax=Campylobacter curvus TaxID=200 RepID=UPI00146FEC85